MTTRATPYRKKPSDKWSALRESLDSQTLYVVQRLGPAGFTVRDDSGEVYRVILGNPHTCSCSDSRSDNECIHLLFCVLKVIRVPHDHPLSWQTSYTDNEVDQALDASSKVIRRPVAARRQVVSALGSHSSEKTPDTATKAVRQPLEGDDNYCPICQDQMLLSQALTWCRNGCGNNIHGKCMKNFAQFRIENKKEVSCPLCREPWVSMAELNNDCKRTGAVRFSCAKVSCNSCTSIVTSDFYRCLECTLVPVQSPSANAAADEKKPPSASPSPVDFCKDCFCRIGRAHNGHHFLTSAAKALYQEFEWKSAANPRTAAMSRFTPEFLQAIQSRELSSADYGILLQLDDQRMHLPSFYETILKSISRLPSHLGNALTKPCFWCSSSANLASTSNESVCVLPCCQTPVHYECILGALKTSLGFVDNSGGLPPLEGADDIQAGSGCLLDTFTCLNPLCQAVVLRRLTRMKVKKVRSSTASGASNIASSNSGISDLSGVPLTGFSLCGVNVLGGLSSGAPGESESRPAAGPGLGRGAIRAASSSRFPPRRPRSQATTTAVNPDSLYIGAAPVSGAEGVTPGVSDSSMLMRHPSPLGTGSGGVVRHHAPRGLRGRSQSASTAIPGLAAGELGDLAGASISGHGIGIAASTSEDGLIAQRESIATRTDPASTTLGVSGAAARRDFKELRTSYSLMRSASPIRTRLEDGSLGLEQLHISSRRLGDIGTPASSSIAIPTAASSAHSVSVLRNGATRGSKNSSNSLVETRRVLAQSSSRDRIAVSRRAAAPMVREESAPDLMVNPIGNHFP